MRHRATVKISWVLSAQGLWEAFPADRRRTVSACMLCGWVHHSSGTSGSRPCSESLKKPSLNALSNLSLGEENQNKHKQRIFVYRLCYCCSLHGKKTSLRSLAVCYKYSAPDFAHSILFYMFYCNRWSNVASPRGALLWICTFWTPWVEKRDTQWMWFGTHVSRTTCNTCGGDPEKLNSA